ncbi:MAG TPA: uroporphyrinogen decarboxylase, partial [Gemmatimonadaceae bacterium]|nr:uroporphyrinogen decarboxylase [Gemmatimonadaceae bacterium]
MSSRAPLLLRAIRRERTERTPVWFMRQAGRVLPEYRAVKANWSLLEISAQPELCAEVTLQPLRRMPLDAAIVYADIMTPLVGVGIQLDIVEAVGPVIAEPVRTRADVDRIRGIEPAEDVPYLLETLRIVRRALEPERALIGFAGAPFTLASYLVEGRGSRNFLLTKAMMYGEPATWHALMDRLTTIVIDYLRAQAHAGADVLQLFDSWVGCLSPQDFREYVAPYSARIFASLKDVGAPLIHFGTNTATFLDQMKDHGADVIGVDWRIALDDAWAIVGHDKAVQGNLDPATLLAPWPVVEGHARDVLRRAGGRPGHIF